ncbi:hypothetical protein [Neobacillus drentensis]|jgi:hypothetical protein
MGIQNANKKFIADFKKVIVDFYSSGSPVKNYLGRFIVSYKEIKKCYVK